MKLIALLTLTLLVSCGKDESMKIIHNNDRVTDLERRVLILEQVVATKASTEDLQALQALVQSELELVKADVQDIADNYLTSEDYQELISLGQDAYDDLLSRIRRLRNKVSNLKSDTEFNFDQLQQSISNLEQAVANIEPVVNVDNSVTFDVQINFNSLFGSINYTVNNITQQTVDLSSIQDRLDALEAAVFEDALGSLQSQINALKAELAALESSSGEGSNGGGNSGLCTVTLINSYSGQKQYLVSVSGLSSYTNYSVELTMNAAISSTSDSNGGPSSLTNNGKKWTIEPQNSASSFNYYMYFSGSNKYVESAKVIKGSTSINCVIVD